MKTINLVFNSFLDAFKIVREAGLKKFYFLPGIISLILFGIFVCLGDYLSLSIATAFENFFKLGEYSSIIYVLIKILIWVCTIFFYYLVYKSLLLVIISPILGYISERVETHLTGKKFDFTFGDNIKFLLRGIDIGLKSFLNRWLDLCSNVTWIYFPNKFIYPTTYIYYSRIFYRFFIYGLYLRKI